MDFDKCDMGVGCNEVHTCFAISQGKPEQCPLATPDIDCQDCEGAECETCGGSGKRRVGVFEPICARHCTGCEGSDHHWDYFGDETAEREPLMSCKHCPALRLMTQDDDANADY